MTSDTSPRPISPLRARMIEDMTVRGFNEHTRSGYVRHVRAFAAFIGRSPRHGDGGRLAPVPTAPDVDRHAALQPRAEGLAFLIWSYLSCYPARFMASPQQAAPPPLPPPGAQQFEQLRRQHRVTIPRFREGRLVWGFSCQAVFPCLSVAAVSARRFDDPQLLEVELGDCLQLVGQS
jgi:hypothetical protein